MSQIEFRLCADNEAEQVQRLREEAFGGPVAQLPAKLAGDCFVLAEQGEIVAALGMQRCRLWFGGQPVDCGVVEFVAVSPATRARGLGTRLTQQCLERLHAQNVALSILQPWTMAPYAKLGYAVAGYRTRYRLPVAHLPRHGSDEVKIRRLTPADVDELKDCYTTVAKTANGFVERPNSLWAALLETKPGEQRPHIFAAVQRETVTGYVVFTEEPGDGPLPHRYRPGDNHANFALACRDLLWTTAEAARSLLALLSGFRATATDLLWTGPPREPLVHFLRERQPLIDNRFGWMLRLADVEAALRQRGYASGVTTELRLRVCDPTFSDQSRAIEVRIADGAATVSPADQAEVEVDVGTLAALYSGALHPADAVRTGGLRGAGIAELAALTAAFGGHEPWVLEL